MWQLGAQSMSALFLEHFAMTNCKSRRGQKRMQSGSSGSGRAAAAVAATSSVIERQRMKDGKKKADCAIFASSHQARRQSRGREREKKRERERGEGSVCGWTRIIAATPEFGALQPN